MLYQYQERSQRRRGKSLKIFMKFFVFFAFILLTFFVFSSIWRLAESLNEEKGEVLSGIVSPLEEIIKEVVKPTELPKIVEAILDKADGTYAVYIEHLKTGEIYEFNENEQFGSASLYKLWVMGETYRQIEEGKLNKNQVMKDEIPKINERFGIATESAELKEGEISMTVDEALYDMIANSDNYSALLLSQTIRLSNVRGFMEEYGYNDSSLDPPTTTAKDIATFFKQLYNKEIIREDVSEEMMDLLLDQTWNDRIPKYLPENIEVAHKTGELSGVKHDGGIVFTDNGDYIIVIMSDTRSESKAAEVEAKISEAVYEYFISH